MRGFFAFCKCQRQDYITAICTVKIKLKINNNLRNHKRFALGIHIKGMFNGWVFIPFVTLGKNYPEWYYHINKHWDWFWVRKDFRIITNIGLEGGEQMQNISKAVISALLMMTILAMSGCASKTPLTKDQEAFAGKWVAKDGTYVQIYLDGGGDLKMSSTSVEGGSATIASGTLTIGLGPIKKSMKITSEPKQVDGKWVMELDGIQYVRQ